MGLFHDTLRDARRPLAGGWVRRTEMDESESLPEEGFAQDSEPSGMQTVFRFQKEGRIPSREASIRSGAVSTRLPAGDPLSAGVQGESPKPSAKNVGATHISVLGDSRESELETGQEERISPTEVAAANVKTESKTFQSVVSSEPIEAGSYRERQPETPEGSEQLVSRQSETFLSRPSGRGAPSETYLNAAIPPRVAGLASPPGARALIQAGETAADDLSSQASDLALPSASPVRHPTGFQAATQRDADGGAAAAYGEFSIAREATPGTAYPQRPGKLDYRSAALASRSYPSARAPEPTPPSLVIGRIDVVVVAKLAPAQPGPAPHSERGFLSRNYLKRL